jgi:L-alanine-DL-glutamate epimerase-like enolase superfamily enzyme
LEFSIEGADYYPWQEGLYVQSPYNIKDGMIALPEGPGWGVEINPNWLSRANYQVSEVK